MNSVLGNTILIDGYNVIKRHPGWADISLLQARSRLIELLRHTRWPFPVARLIVFFDAPEDHLARIDSDKPAIEVRYAAASADSAMQAFMRQAKQPERLVCISDDRAIQHTAKSHGSRLYPGRWLFEHRASSHAAKQGDVGQKSLSAAQARMITEDLARHWLG